MGNILAIMHVGAGVQQYAGDVDDVRRKRFVAIRVAGDVMQQCRGAEVTIRRIQVRARMMVAFYWENFIYFGQGPRKTADGKVVLALPLGGGKLPGIAAEDIGRCAYGIFQRGPDAAGQRFGIAGEVLSGPEYAAAFSRHLGVPISFYDMPFDEYRALGFPGADDMGNMYEHHAILGEEFRRHRSPEVARALNPALQSFDSWLSANASRIPLG